MAVVRAHEMTPDNASATGHAATLTEFYSQVIGAGCTVGLLALVAADYQPHAPEFAGVPTLLPGLTALRDRLSRTGAIAHRVARIISDGDLAFAHVKYSGNAPVAGVDVFQFNDAGKIAAHWNVRQPLPLGGTQGEDRFASDVTPDANLGLDPAWLKSRIKSMLVEMWGKGNASLVPDFYDQSYVQHNAEMPGGYYRILEVVQTEIPKYIARTGEPYPINLHCIVAQGDLVGIHISIFMAGINRQDGVRANNVDIFRVDRHGRMVEHWDVLHIDGIALPSLATLF